eukprot:752071-Rhodomonas_salina.1
MLDPAALKASTKKLLNTTRISDIVKILNHAKSTWKEPRGQEAEGEGAEGAGKTGGGGAGAGKAGGGATGHRKTALCTYVHGCAKLVIRIAHLCTAKMCTNECK